MARRQHRRRGIIGTIVLLWVHWRAHKLEQRSANAEAIRIGGWFLARWHGNAGLYATLAAAHWDLSHWKECIRFGRLCMRLDPSRVQTANYMLSAYRSAGEFLRGIAFGERWLARHPAATQAWRHLSFLYDDLDRTAEALAAAQRGLKHGPEDIRLASVVAHYLARQDGPESALRFAGPYRARFASDSYCENTLAEGLNSGGAHKEAEGIFASLVAKHPRNTAFFANLLGCRIRLGKFEEVLLEAKTWEESRHEVTAAIANEAGRACLELGRGDEALAWMRRAMALEPGTAKYADNHAVSLGRLDRHAECIEACTARLKAPGSPDRRRLLQARAIAHSWLKQHEQAMADYRQVFAEFPRNDEALVNVIVGLTWLDRYAEGAEFAQQHRGSRGPTMPARYWSEFAWCLHNTGRHEDELSVVGDWQRLHPHDPDVVRCRNRALNKLGRRAEALALAREWVDAHPDSAWGWRHLAEQHHECGDGASELHAMEEACRLAPDSVGFAVARIGSLRSHKRPKEAFETGCEWEKNHPDGVSAELLNRIGLAADDLHDYAAAEGYCRRAHLMQPCEGIWFGNVLRTLILQDRATEAVGLGRGWLETHGWSSYVASKLAWALRTAGLLAEETALLRKAVDTDPDNSDLRFDLLTSLVAQKRTDEARSLVDDAIAAGRATGRLCNDLANHIRDLGLLDEAEARYRAAQAIAPDNDVVAGNLASLFTFRRRYSEAVELCRRWLERRPDDAYVRRQLANAHYHADDHHGAEREYAALLEREPDSQYLFGQWLACLRLLGRFAEVLEESARWLATNKPTAFILVENGIAAHKLGRRDEALAHFEAALQLEPARVVAAERKMNILAETGRLDLALDFAEAWVAANPAAAGADFHNDLGILTDRAGRTARAEACFLRAAELDPENATIAGNAVELIARRGRPAEAIALGQRFLAASPPNAYLMRRLAEVHAAQQDHQTALELLASADALAPSDADVAHAYLRIARDAGEPARGMEFGRGWLARPENARHAGVWVHHARLCYDSDRNDEAMEAVETAVRLEPDNLAHVRTRFAYLAALDDNTRLIAEFEAVRPAWRDDPELLRHASRSNLDLGLGEEALALALKNTAANPADEDACAWLAELHERCGRTDEARACIAAWISVHGEQPAVLKVRARIAFHAKEYAQARSDAERVLVHNRTDEEAFTLLVRAMRALGRGPEARARVNHWLEHNRASPAIERLLEEEDTE